MTARSTTASRRVRPRDLAVVFLLALAFRVGYFVEASRKPDFGLYYMDQEIHLRWAEGLAGGKLAPPFDRLAEGPYFRAPLYPWFLAALLRLDGGSIPAARVLQLVLGALSAALVTAVATKVHGRRAGVVAGLLAAFSWVLTYFDGELLLPVLLVFLLLAGTLALFTAVERRNAPVAALAGFLFGLFAITRPNILAFFPIAVLWLFAAWPAASGRRGAVLLFAAAFLLPPAAVTVRNGVAGGDWAIVASQGGVNFFIGNNARSNGLEAVVPGTRPTWWGGYDDTVRFAEEAEGRKLRPSEVSSFWFRRGLRFIADEPAAWLRLTGRKFLALAGNVELPNNEPYEARRGEYVTLRGAPVGFGLLLALFLASFLPGGGRAEPDARRFRVFTHLFLGTYALTVVAFFVTGRYRVPLVPFLAVGAAWTIVRFADDLRAKRLGREVITALVALPLAFTLHADPLGVRAATRGFADLTRAQDLLGGGDPGGAIEVLEPRIDREDLGGVEAYRTLIHAYAARQAPGDREKIAGAAESAVRLAPDDPELLWFAAVGRADAKEWEGAATMTARYLEKKPDDLRALYLAFSAARALGRTDEAERFLGRAEAVAPGDPLTARMRAAFEPR